MANRNNPSLGMYYIDNIFVLAWAEDWESVANTIRGLLSGAGNKWYGNDYR